MRSILIVRSGPNASADVNVLMPNGGNGSVPDLPLGLPVLILNHPRVGGEVGEFGEVRGGNLLRPATGRNPQFHISMESRGSAPKTGSARKVPWGSFRY